MVKAFRYRIYPNKIQEKLLNETLSVNKDLYNFALEHRQMMWKFYKKKIGYYDQAAELKEIRVEYVRYKNVSCSTLQNTLRRLDIAYERFLNGISNFPKFKTDKTFNTVEYSNQTITFKNGKFRIPKIGLIKIKLSRSINGKILKILVNKNNVNQWHISFVCDVQDKSSNLGGEVAIDLGISKFATLSNGEVIENPKFFDKSKEKLKQRQQSLSRKIKGSKNYSKAKELVAKTYLKIKNQREDFQHKAVNKLLKDNKVVYIEDLNIKQMISKERSNSINRSILDAGWCGFIEKVSYKSEVYCNKIFKIEPRNTSKTCSNCLNIKDGLELNDRVYKCENCGIEIDRDLNAAYNILRAGQALVAAKA